MEATQKKKEKTTHIPVQSIVQSVSPTVPVVPVKVAIHGEEAILGARVRKVSDQRVDKFLVGITPGLVNVGNHSCRVDEIAIMEVVVIVVCVAWMGYGQRR